MDTLAKLRSLADRYAIEREIGAGGMATVYLARDLKHDREVALKVLRADLSAALGTERFLSEIRIAARLDHPHILTLIDSGSADELLYYVLPYVRGESLRAKLDREKQLGVRDAVSITTQVAGALDYAHAQGVIHRDIKPENILLHEGEAVLTDFGIALAVKQAGGERLTGTGLSLGTPMYMSPEQAMGERAPDRRSDVYSLGAVFYEMIAGEPPVTGSSAQAIIAKLLTEKPVKLRVLRETVPFSMERATEKALAKTPADRFSSAGEFARALSAAAGEPEESFRGSRINWAVASTNNWTRRHWRALLAVALVAITGSFWSIQSRRNRGAIVGREQKLDQKYVVAVLPFENLSADTSKTYVAAGLTEEITGQLSRLSALRVLSRSVVNPYRNAPDRLPKMVSELGVGSVVEGSVRAEGNRAMIAVRLIDARSGAAIWSQQYDRQLTDLFEVQSQVAKSITEALRASLTPEEARRAGRPPTVNLEAYQLYMGAEGAQGKSPAQMLAAVKSLQLAIKLDTTFALAYGRLARLYLFLAATTNPAYRDSGLVAARKAIAVDPDNASAYVTLGGLLGESGKLQAGKTTLLKAFDLNPNSDPAAQDLAVTLGFLGAYDEALVWAVRAVSIAPTNPVPHYHVAAVLLRLGDDTASERFVLNVQQRFASSTSTWRSFIFMRLGVLLSLLEVLRGRNELAMERARRVLLDNPGDQEATLNLGLVASLTNAADAEELLAPLAASSPATRAEVFPETMQTLYAAVLARRGKRSAADSLWKSALARARGAVEEGNEAPEPRVEIAAINAMRHDNVEAMKWLELGYHAGYKDPRVLARDPLFESLRADARYGRLVTKMKSDVDSMRRRAAATNDTLFTRKAR